MIAASDDHRRPLVPALPTCGGHVVSGTPLLSNLQDLVSPADEQPSLSVEAGAPPAEWVVGFHHDRGALLRSRPCTGAGAEGTPENRFQTVEIQVSTTSPVGPWLPLTTWTLDPASTVTQTLTLDARAGVLCALCREASADTTRYEYPDALAIDEHPLTAQAIARFWPSGAARQPTAILWKSCRRSRPQAVNWMKVWSQ